jgi:hypothetical protein
LLQTPETLRARFNLDVRVNTEVMAIDRAAQVVKVRELASARAVLPLLSPAGALATVSAARLAPPAAYPLLAPALRRPFAAGVPLTLCSTGPVDLGFAPVEVVGTDGAGWPGMPIILGGDDRTALIAARRDAEVRGHWSSAPAFVAAARLALERMRRP